MKPVHLRNVPPPSETFDHISFLETFAKWIKPERYLELGVRDMKCFRRISRYSVECVGVDMQPLSAKLEKKMIFFHGTTDDYFKSIENANIQFDLVFIDADHSFEQSLKDFMNVSKHVIEDGFIFMHDTYPYDSRMLSPDLCNDAFKTPHYIKQHLFKEFEIITLPFNPGLSIIKKISWSKQLSYL
jgi:predicted O-methyltransferase YrrM